MKKTSQCDETRDQLLLAADGESVSEACETHLEKCADCRRFQECLTMATPTFDLDDAPPPELDNQVLAYARHRRSQEKPKSVIRFPLLVRLAAAAAAVALAAIGARMILESTVEDSGPPPPITDVLPGKDDWRDETITADLTAAAAEMESEFESRSALGTPLPDAILDQVAADIDRELHALQAELYFVAVAFD